MKHFLQKFQRWNLLSKRNLIHHQVTVCCLVRKVHLNPQLLSETPVDLNLIHIMDLGKQHQALTLN